MKKIILLITAVALACAPASAQSLLERLGQRAKNAAEQNIGNKVEKGVNDILNGNNGKGRNQQNQQSGTEMAGQAGHDDSGAVMPGGDRASQWTCPECGTANTGKFCEQCGAKKPEGVPEAKSETVKSDFVPGTVVIFEDKLEGEQIGEFPSRWDLMNHNAEVARMAGRMAIKFEHGSDTKITPLVEDGNRQYLPEVFTLEFDYFVPQNEQTCHYRLLFQANDHNDDVYWNIAFNQDQLSYVVSKPNSDEFVQGNADLAKMAKRNAWNHFALSFNKRALKVYVNDIRVINIPNANKPQWFNVETEFWEDHIDFITDVRLAKGGVELYEQKVTDMSPIEKAIAETGKFVTNNILFDTGKATIKPESQEEIQKVADYMLKNPGARFEVQGHTDNQGSDKVNDPLSQERAEAVVKALEGLGVDPFNLRAVGKGSHEPVADNSTDEGRAKNRRVEFVVK